MPAPQTRDVQVYLLGGADGVAADAAARLKERFASTANCRQRAAASFATMRSRRAIVREIAASGAKLLLAGIGSPRQEYWLAEHLRESGCGVGIGVGGSFDVIAGRIERAPTFARRLGLEWLPYRLAKEPRRWRRQLALPRFVGLVALDALRRTQKSVVRS